MNIDKDTKTVGAYILYNGYFFLVGYGKDKESGKLGAFRFDGHLEPNETLVECVKREVKKEASLNIELYSSPITYILQSTSSEYMKLEEKIDKDCNPIFICPKINGKLSVMYFAYGIGEIIPSMETQEILSLTQN